MWPFLTLWNSWIGEKKAFSCGSGLSQGAYHQTPLQRKRLVTATAPAKIDLFAFNLAIFGISPRNSNSSFHSNSAPTRNLLNNSTSWAHLPLLSSLTFHLKSRHFAMRVAYLTHSKGRGLGVLVRFGAWIRACIKAFCTVNQNGCIFTNKTCFSNS